jgi:16S rRNA A1518/A1519 N6-dimethyltransferase RsmA/KsgA/DIM1 with predicted DNA glycosylase/AP lyase activity
MLLGNLKSSFENSIDLNKIFSELSISEKQRAENLKTRDWARLAKLLR